MKRIILFVLVVGGLWAEPSVYSNSSSTSSRQVKRNQNAIYKLKQETARLREEIEGLRSIIEGLNRTVGRWQQQGGSGRNGDKKLLTDMTNLIDKINQNYVSKAELKRALKNGRIATAKKPSSVNVKKSSTKTSGTANLAKASSSALYSKGVRLVGKKHYTDAKKRFDILASRGYKKAATHFYLGEIAYRTSRYTQAVDQYKQSAELNENAGYMDKLLLHTGISLEKGGDRDQAKRFFQAIVDGYPDTASAKVAKKHL
jgi:TolA-binding protein